MRPLFHRRRALGRGATFYGICAGCTNLRLKVCATCLLTLCPQCGIIYMSRGEGATIERNQPLSINTLSLPWI